MIGAATVRMAMRVSISFLRFGVRLHYTGILDHSLTIVNSIRDYFFKIFSAAASP
jgi:hypothetical protein